MSSKINISQGAKDKNIFLDSFSKVKPKAIVRLNKNTGKNVVASSNDFLLKNSNKIHLNSENVRVIIRIRPFDVNGNSESLQGCVEVVDSGLGKKKIILEDPRHRALPKSYEFDEIYDTNSSTEYIYSKEVRDFVNPLLSECTCINVFAFGSSGTGKTYTMHGGEGDDVGIVGLTVKQLIEKNNKQDTPGRFSFSFFEVYCEKIQDLLSGIECIKNPGDTNRTCSSGVSIRTDICGRIRVIGTVKSEFVTWDDFYKVYSQALRKRTSGKTSVNSVSSRSHACIQINYIPPVDNSNRDKTNISTEDTIENRKRRGSISFHVKPKINTNYPRTIVNLIDLSGFENNRITNNSGRRMVESTFINSSILSLSKVINALKKNDGTSFSQSCIPYRESKLTRLLQEYLGGGADPPYSPYCLRCIMICTISPSITFFQQTYATLNTPTYGNKTEMMKYVGIVSPRIREKETLNEKCDLHKINHMNKKFVINTPKYLNSTIRINQKNITCTSSKASFDTGKVLRKGTCNQISNVRSYKNVESRVARMIKGEIPFHQKSPKIQVNKTQSIYSIKTNLKDRVSNFGCDENSKDYNSNLLNVSKRKGQVNVKSKGNIELQENIINEEETEIELISSSLNSLDTFETSQETRTIQTEEIEIIYHLSNTENTSESCNIESGKYLFVNSEEELRGYETQEKTDKTNKVTEIKLMSDIAQNSGGQPKINSVNRPVTRSQTKRRD
ncbi:kinesin heavy chain [Cryptosporidium ryanae]|uniref:kinesin heavy chain n=1 Tax=Cryptosporidium ryanae TaxID=515981 RepID=UPI00351A233E|nr:kinesin heavy chain [Cryptosporidium ryanae]